MDTIEDLREGILNYLWFLERLSVSTTYLSFFLNI